MNQEAISEKTIPDRQIASAKFLSEAKEERKKGDEGRCQFRDNFQTSQVLLVSGTYCISAICLVCRLKDPGRGIQGYNIWS